MFFILFSSNLNCLAFYKYARKLSHNSISYRVDYLAMGIERSSFLFLSWSQEFDIWKYVAFIDSDNGKILASEINHNTKFNLT